MYILIINMRNGDNQILGYHESGSYLMDLAKKIYKARKFEIRKLDNLALKTPEIDPLKYDKVQSQD